MKKKTMSIAEVIRDTNDIELLNYIGSRIPHLQNLIYKKILEIEKYHNERKWNQKETKKMSRRIKDDIEKKYSNYELLIIEFV